MFIYFKIRLNPLPYLSFLSFICIMTFYSKFSNLLYKMKRSKAKSNKTHIKHRHHKRHNSTPSPLFSVCIHDAIVTSASHNTPSYSCMRLEIENSPAHLQRLFHQQRFTAYNKNMKLRQEPLPNLLRLFRLIFPFSFFVNRNQFMQ